MKKLSVFILVLFLSLNTTFACKITDESKEIPKDFKESCYEKISYINPNASNYTCWRFTYKIASPEKVDTFIFDKSIRYITPHKLYKKAWENINYSINLAWDKNYLQDENYKTFLQQDTSDENREILINFDELQKAWTLSFWFKYETDNFKPHFEISEDGKSYITITRWNITDYDFK